MAKEEKGLISMESFWKFRFFIPISFIFSILLSVVIFAIFLQASSEVTAEWTLIFFLGLLLLRWSIRRR